MVYTVTLNPALDYVLSVDKLNFDDINRASEEKIYYGGKGINVSAILSQLNIENKALGFVGGFSGKKLCELLEKDSINTDFTEITSGETRINVKIKSETELDINADGPSVSDKETEKFFEKIKKISDNDFVVLAGSVPKSFPENIYEKIIENLSEKKVNFIIDTADKSLKALLKYNPFLIKPNHHELGDFFGTKIESENDIIFYAKELQKLGAKNVLVSRAENGAILLDENGYISKTGTASGKLINSVGCGDSMVAGFIAGYIERHNYEYALRLGTACGCATAFSPTLAKRKEIFNILETL